MDLRPRGPAPLHERYLLGVCQPTEYEMLHSARDSSEATGISTWLHAFDYHHSTDDAFTRALQAAPRTQRGLPPGPAPPRPPRRRHRGIEPADRPPYDGDFDMITSLTGQPAEWVVPPGSADH
ncbi:VapC toxin family PIN domain ribonuclease [Streptomyces sp. NBC_01190]|uniref:VapC toxin family PIN domain ribonuclease n=1 Tax=Streptomyces sp. NBC_01190 TaxID=2903767 RepID=UPI00386BA6F1|nr:VapC toxin family PIN domain ribonuclease [Streptomyces sp. NBC_01190]